MEQENNFSLFEIKEVSIPLINLPFRYNNKVNNLNKDNLLATSLSYIPCLAYKNTLSKFVKDFKMKTNEFNQKVRDYMHSHHIYSTPLKEDMHGITNHTGDIFINSKYLKEYFEHGDENSKLIVREKIVWAFLQELNNGLIRYLDPKKYSNLITLYTKEKEGIKLPAKSAQLKFKKLKTGELKIIPLKKSIDNFNHILFGGYIFDEFTIEIARFLLYIRYYRGKKIHMKKIKSMFDAMKNKNKSGFNGEMLNISEDIMPGKDESSDESNDNEDEEENDE